MSKFDKNYINKEVVFCTIKQSIEEKCKILGLSKENTETIYNYYKENKGEFMFNPKVFYESSYIVDIIRKKFKI